MIQKPPFSFLKMEIRRAIWPLIISSPVRSDLTPIDLENENSKEAANALDYGLSGISTCSSKSGFVVYTTICRMKDGKDADCVYRSYDYGET